MRIELFVPIINWLKFLRSRLLGVPSVNDYRNAGAIIGDGFVFAKGFTLDLNDCWLITIGDDVTIAPHVSIVAHDASLRKRIGYARVRPVTIGHRVFVGTRAIILPGVTVGDDAVIAAGSLVTTDVAPSTLVAGVPARAVGAVSETEGRWREQLAIGGPRFERGWKADLRTVEGRKRMRSLVGGGTGWVY